MTNKQAKQLIESLKNKILTREQTKELKRAIAIVQGSCFNMSSEINSTNT